MQTNKTKESSKEKIKKLSRDPGLSDTESIIRLLDVIENTLRSIRKILSDKQYRNQAITLVSPRSGNIIEGVFDGEEMVDQKGKKYSVSPNYASKSKLIPGDILKLTIATDGTFIYKQIGPVERKKIIGELQEDNGEYHVLAGGRNYRVLAASITYFKARVGDKLTIIIPKNKESEFAAVENIIGK